jgi:hypothetical protein
MKTSLEDATCKAKGDYHVTVERYKKVLALLFRMHRLMALVLVDVCLYVRHRRRM